MLGKDSLKNLGTRQLAIYTAFIVSILVTLMFFFYAFVNRLYDHPVIIGLVLLGAIFFVTYLVINLVLRQYIFRRIKLIYKRIQKSKVSMPRHDKQSTDDISLMEVEKDVEKWASQQEKEIETLKTLEEYRRNFLGNVSHELKTPIFSIQGYIFTLLDGGLHDEAINEKYLIRAAKNVERLLTIVKDLDQITKLESNQLQVEMQVFDIKELVEEVFLDAELAAKDRKTQLIFKDGANQSFNVKADREYIRQVINNLVINSIKYGKKGGFTKVSFYDMFNQILVEIADDGIGIEEKHLKYLFDRFYRVDKSRSRKSGGSGLGLAIVKHILEAHNQSISVRSTKGLGSTFNFTLDKA